MSAYRGRHWLLQIAQPRSPSNDAIGCPSMSAPLYPLRVSLCRKTDPRKEPALSPQASGGKQDAPLCHRKKFCSALSRSRQPLASFILSRHLRVFQGDYIVHESRLELDELANDRVSPLKLSYSCVPVAL